MNLTLHFCQHYKQELIKFSIRESIKRSICPVQMHCSRFPFDGINTSGDINLLFLVTENCSLVLNMMKPLFKRPKKSVEGLLGAVHLLSVSQLDTLSILFIMNSYYKV